jgi:hypothetical protein
MNDIDRLDVHVGSAPHPGLIRSRIEAVLAGRASEPGPEQVIGQAVASAVTDVMAIAGPGAVPAAPGVQEGGPG